MLFGIPSPSLVHAVYLAGTDTWATRKNSSVCGSLAGKIDKKTLAEKLGWTRLGLVSITGRR